MKILRYIHITFSIFTFYSCSNLIDNNEIQNITIEGMKLIKGGSFNMGDLSGLILYDEIPIHEVIVLSFLMDSTEVTQQEFNEVMGYNPSINGPGDRLPVDNVSWFECVSFCNIKSKRYGYDTAFVYDSLPNYTHCLQTNNPDKFKVRIVYHSNGYRLPTEAEWEYACRANTTTINYWGNTMNPDYCWIGANSFLESSHNVALKLPNSFGLYDMIGNVWEFCFDWKGSYNDSSQINPLGPTVGREKVKRGCCYACIEDGAHSSNRTSINPFCSGEESLGQLHGFRTVRSYPYE